MSEPFLTKLIVSVSFSFIGILLIVYLCACCKEEYPWGKDHKGIIISTAGITLIITFICLTWWWL